MDVNHSNHNEYKEKPLDNDQLSKMRDDISNILNTTAAPSRRTSTPSISPSQITKHYNTPPRPPQTTNLPAFNHDIIGDSSGGREQYSPSFSSTVNTDRRHSSPHPHIELQKPHYPQHLPTIREREKLNINAHGRDPYYYHHQRHYRGDDRRPSESYPSRKY